MKQAFSLSFMALPDSFGQSTNKPNKPGHGAFSLVELSIVLVILGLLAGGILTGQSLIRAAELRSVTTEFQAYRTAGMTFRDKYFALPGDMTNATDFWGADPDGCPGDYTDSTPTEATCNGDGDGILDATDLEERWRFWQQLANADLIEGSYIGVSASSFDRDAIPGTNIPASRVSGGGWYMLHFDTTGNTNNFAVNYGNSLQIGGNPGSSDAGVNLPLFTPEEVWNIDKKMDDGMPGKGKVLVHFREDCTDATSVTDYDAGYDLDNTAVACTIKFKDAY